MPTGQGWLYVASVLGLGSRRLLGYSMADHMRTELVADALTMAAGVRGGATSGTVFHGDRGSHYSAAGYQALVAELGMVQSVGRTGVCWDNSVAESFWSSLKRELVARYRSRTERRPAERSLPGSTPTTTGGSTRAWATPRPSSGKTTTVNPRPTRPRNPRDRSTGGASVVLRALRGAAGWSQLQLAVEVHRDHSYVSKWERGALRPDVDDVTRVADALGLAVTERALLSSAWACSAAEEPALPASPGELSVSLHAAATLRRLGQPRVAFELASRDSRAALELARTARLTDLQLRDFAGGGG